MADFNSSLPVRTESAGDVIAKIADATTPSQQASVDASGRLLARITDTAGNSLNSTSNALDVNVTNASVTISGTVTANQGTAAAGTAGWPTIMGNVAESTAAWTSATSVNAAVTETVTNYSTVVVTLNQTTTITGGVVTFEVSDTAAFTNAYPILGVAPDTLATGLTYTLQASTNKSWVFNVAGWAAFRVRLSTVITGTGTVNVGVQANAAGTTPTAASSSVGASSTVNQGNAGSNAQAWWTQIGDTTNGPVAVKPASTAALATDPSLVTAFSPNSPLPTGSNVIGALTANQSVNLAQVDGATTATAATGVQKVGIVGNTGAAMDAAGQNAASPANELLVAGQFNTTPTTLTSGNVSPLQMDSAANLLVNLKTALPAGSNLIGSVNVFQGGAATSPSNPIYVDVVAAGGTPVDSYQTSASLAAAATANLDYTVTTGKTFYCQQLWASASGKIKVVVAFETAAGSGTFVTYWVGFNSTSEPNILIPLPPTKTQVSAAKIRVAITNEDKQSQDVYETLSGNEQ